MPIVPTTSLGWKQPSTLLAYQDNHPLHAEWLAWIEHPQLHSSDYCNCSKGQKKGIAIGCRNCGTCSNCHKQVDSRIFYWHVQACSGVLY